MSGDRREADVSAGEGKDAPKQDLSFLEPDEDQLHDATRGGDGEQGAGDGNQPQETAEERIARLEQALADRDRQYQRERSARTRAQQHTVRLQQETDQVRERLDRLERQEAEERGAREKANFDARVVTAERELAAAEEDGDPSKRAAAQRALHEAVTERALAARGESPRRTDDARDDARSGRERQETRETRREERPAPPPVEGAMADWMEANPWYTDPATAQDQVDAQDTANIAQVLAANNPHVDTNSKVFWDHVDQIRRQRHPHRFQQQRKAAGNGAGGDPPATSRTGGGGRASDADAPNINQLPPETVKAMRMAGKDPNDPEQRKKYMAYVREIRGSMGAAR